MGLLTRAFEILLGRGWGKDVAAGANDPPNLLSPCALSPSKPHFYGRKEGRGTKCLRCGFERTGK